MRRLVILRGIPASGKSTFVHEHGLSPYTISTDDIRLMYGCPTVNIDGSFGISQKDNKKVFNFLFERLEERMRKGEFIIIDATHCNKKDFNKYKSLAKLYRYTTYAVDFDIDPSDAKNYNSGREEHKRVPDDVIDRMHEKKKSWSIPSWAIKVTKQEFKKRVLLIKPFDLSMWNKIHHLGDIHGCYDTLMEFVGDGFKDDELYIFTGDLFDRGTQNKQMLKFVFDNYNKDNVIFIEGNHDTPMYYYGCDKPEYYKTRVFLNDTKKQIEGGLSEDEIVQIKKMIRKSFKEFKSMLYYEYNGELFFVTHGGMAKFPRKISLVPDINFIRGVGNYDTDVDNLWNSSIESYTSGGLGNQQLLKIVNSDCHQIHGHRNSYQHDIRIGEKSFNLEGGVEQGGELRVLTLTKQNGAVSFQESYIKNDSVKLKESFDNEVAKLVDDMRQTNFIKEKQLGSNISSFNFTRKAFKKGVWNELTTKARGLFINTHYNEIVARGYDKFFNVNEVESTKYHNLKKSLKFPLRVFEKPNGYLGLIGYDSETDNLVFASKSTVDSDHAKWFKEIFYDKTNDMSRYYLKNFLKIHNCSLTFEVISKKDPHIIEYEKDNIILLDIIDRGIKFKKCPYGVSYGEYELVESVTTLAGVMGFDVKKLLAKFKNFEQFDKWYQKEKNDTSKKIEGYVIEDEKGFMFKMKLPYYVFWKQMRVYKDMYMKGIHGNFNQEIHPHFFNTLVKFSDFIDSFDVESLQSVDIIELRNKFEKETEK